MATDSPLHQLLLDSACCFFCLSADVNTIKKLFSLDLGKRGMMKNATGIYNIVRMLGK